MSTSISSYKRILLKISGESFGTQQPFEMTVIENIAREIAEAHNAGTEIGIVIGGGNIVRGASLQKHGIHRTVADYMGMLGTVINALALQDILCNLGLEARIMTARRFEDIGEPYHYQRCYKHLAKKRVVIFAGGTGSPYFTTDTAAALKSVEMNAQVFFKATKVNGVYDGDPQTMANAKRYSFISYEKILEKQFGVMDSTAVAFCRENNMPIRVFNLMLPGNLLRAVSGEEVGTLVHRTEDSVTSSMYTS